MAGYSMVSGISEVCHNYSLSNSPGVQLYTTTWPFSPENHAVKIHLSLYHSSIHSYMYHSSKRKPKRKAVPIWRLVSLGSYQFSDMMCYMDAVSFR